MLFAIETLEDLEKLEELESVRNQVEKVRLQDKLGKQNFHEIIKTYMAYFLIQLKIPLTN